MFYITNMPRILHSNLIQFKTILSVIRNQKTRIYVENSLQSIARKACWELLNRSCPMPSPYSSYWMTIRILALVDLSPETTFLPSEQAVSRYSNKASSAMRCRYSDSSNLVSGDLIWWRRPRMTYAIPNFEKTGLAKLDWRDWKITTETPPRLEPGFPSIVLYLNLVCHEED